MDDLIICNSKFKYIPLLLGSIGFVVAGIFCISIGRPEIGWVSIIFFGSGIPLSIHQMLDNRPKLVINNQGIIDRRWKIKGIAWRDIQSTQVVSIGEQKFLGLHLKEEAKYLNELSPLQRKVAEMNRRFDLPPFCIHLSQLNLEGGQIVELVNKYLQSNRVE
jgi:hypothetical protein